MTVVAALLSLVLAATTAASARAKLVGAAPVVAMLDRLGALRYTRTIGGGEAVLAVTFLVGVFSEDWRRVAALGLLGLMSAAVVFQFRAGDRGTDLGPPLMVGAVALLTAVISL